LSNAVKFTQEGQVVLRARGYAAGNQVTIRIEVEDTGIGIPEDKQALIFEPFAQADDSITRLYGGTGLGTTIARHLVHQMGGRIGLVSVAGKGSTFWIELPLVKSEPQGVDLSIGDTAVIGGAPDPRATTNVRKIHGAKILVAEDNPTNQRVAQLILESRGHKVTLVENGEEALESLEKENFDLALFDLSMPVVSGLEALKLYRFSTANPIPVVILSANVTADTIAECERAGAQEFVAKPLRASILLDTIDRHLAAQAGKLGFTSRPEERQPLTVVDTPLLDARVLEDLTKLSRDPTFVDRLLQGYCADVDRLVTQICDGFAARKYEMVKDAAHALKGGSGSVGAMQLMQLATRLDKATHDTLRMRSTAFVEELRKLSAQTVAQLTEYLRSRARQKGSDRNA
jgi:two-component system sensor histidine kinase RpfC